MKILGNEIDNDQLYIKSYHYPSTVVRDYSYKDIVPSQNTTQHNTPHHNTTQHTFRRCIYEKLSGPRVRTGSSKRDCASAVRMYDGII